MKWMKIFYMIENNRQTRKRTWVYCGHCKYKQFENVSCFLVQLLVQWTVQHRFIGNDGKEEQTTRNQFAFLTSLTGRQARQLIVRNFIGIHYRAFTQFRHHMQSNVVECCTCFLPKNWSFHSFEAFHKLRKTKRNKIELPRVQPSQWK